MTKSEIAEITREIAILKRHWEATRPVLAKLTWTNPNGEQWVDLFTDDVQPTLRRIERLEHQLKLLRQGKTPITPDDARTVSTRTDAPPPQELSAVEAQAILEGRNVAKRLDRYIRLWNKREQLTNERRVIKNLITADAVMKARYQDIGKQVSQINFRLKVYRGEKPRERRKP